MQGRSNASEFLTQDTRPRSNPNVGKKKRRNRCFGDVCASELVFDGANEARGKSPMTGIQSSGADGGGRGAPARLQ